MSIQESNSKRIIKNTIILYIRMIVVLLITLYTSRIVLKALGVDDYGLYNVVGGVVGLLSFFNVTMSRSTQRFLNVAMADGEKSIGDIFASSITVHVLIAVLFLVLGETLGLWFLNEKIQIPEGRELASNIVYQASIFSFCIAIVTIPYNAVVIAYEKMSFVAIVSIIDAVLKLLIAFLLLLNLGDNLILYGVLLLLITILDSVLYYIYCRINYKFIRFTLSFDKNSIKKIFGFVSWTLVGESAQVGCNQGNVILVNLFHSLVANAAMTIGAQINNALQNLTSNFQTAFNPQITKSYAEGDYNYLKKLVYATSKMSFCILFIVALPVSFNINWILHVWLDEVPTLSNVFAILFLVNAIMNAISSPFHFVVLASGNIRRFQIVSAVVYLLDLPLAFVLFKMGLPAPSVLWVKIATMLIIVFIRIRYASRVVPTINTMEYFLTVILPLLLTSLLVVFLAFYFDGQSSVLGVRFAFTVIIEIICLALLWWVCFSKEEKGLLITYLKNKKDKYV